MRDAYKWWLVVALWLICFCNYADRQAIYSVLPQLRHQLHLSELQLGILGSAFMWVYALSGPLAGWIADRLSPKIVVLGALAFWSLVTWGTGFCTHYSSLLSFRALGGFSEAFYIPAAMALIGSYHSPETRSRAMALHQSGVYVGTVAGGSLAGVLAQQHGWAVSFRLLGIAGLLLVPLAMLSIRKPPEITRSSSGTKRELSAELLQVLKNPFSNTLIAVFFGANFVATVFLAWLPLFLFQRFHMSLGSAGIYGTVYLQFASVAGAIAGGIFGDRAAARFGGRQKVQAIALVLGIPFLVVIGQSDTMTAFVIGVLGFGFAKGIYDGNLWASLYDVVPRKHRGLAAGTMNSVGWLGGGLSSLLVAVIAQRFGLGACISATAGIYLILAFGMTHVAARMARARTTASSSDAAKESATQPLLL